MRKNSDRQKKSASKPTNPISQIRGAAGSKDNWWTLRLALESTKFEAAPTDYLKLLKIAHHSELLPVAIAGAASRPRKAAPQAVEPLAAASLTREILWACAVLSFARHSLASFNKQRSDFFYALLTGSYLLAEEKLDEIDHDHGLSLWALENRIALLSFKGGLEAQKAFLSTLSRDFKRTFVSFYSANIGERNESRVSVRGYESRLRERAKGWQIAAGSKSYIFFKLLEFGTPNSQEAADILSHEAASSPIDLYETLIRLLVGLAAAGERIDDEAISSLKKLRLR